MEVLPALAVGLLTLYAIACGIAGPEPGAPLWLRWPQPIWNFISHDWRRPAPAPRRPDYAKIERLERELGMVDAEPEKPIRLARTVCLTKNCAGDTHEIRTWSGVLAMRIHHCARELPPFEEGMKRAMERGF